LLSFAPCGINGGDFVLQLAPQSVGLSKMATFLQSNRSYLLLAAFYLYLSLSLSIYLLLSVSLAIAFPFLFYSLFVLSLRTSLSHVSVSLLFSLM
jgi:hypothetical protein